MNFSAYLEVFQEILKATPPPAPYNNPDYFNYTQLNWSRQQRWLKHGELQEELVNKLQQIRRPQHWIIITEPWCGDAAHSVPFLEKLAISNPLIQTDYQLRDAAPHLINSYLTHGTKSIPKLIIRNENNEDLAIWGPRPEGCQQVYDVLKAEKADFEQTKIAIQKWYNEDKGVSLQRELLSIVTQLPV